MTVTAAEPVFDAERVVETHAHAITGLLLVENPGFVSGGCTLWWGERILGTDQAGLFARAAQAPPGSDGVLFLPAPAGAGIRDVILVVVLGSVMSTGQALVVVVTSRVILIACDLALAGLAGAATKRPRSTSPSS